MHAHNSRTTFRRHNAVALALSFVVLCGLSYSRAQEPGKGEREVVEKIPKHLPIKVKIKRPEKLKDAENEDWLDDLEVEVTNTGTKPIYFLEIVIDMPDVFAPNGLNIACPLRYGRGELIAFSKPVRPEDVPIHPGGVVLLMVPADQAESWKRGRAEGKLTNPKRVEVFFQQINFGDGTGFLGTTGRPIPEPREQGANASCAGGDSDAVGAASVAHPPWSYFPDIASLATYLPPPANLVPAFFLGRPASLAAGHER